VHTSPFMKLAAQIQKRDRQKESLEASMNAIKSGLFKEVRELQTTMESNMNDLNNKLKLMEKYM
jgi:hypothetical protein